MIKEELLDLKDSELVLAGDKNEQEAISDLIDAKVDELRQDFGERKQIYGKRHDFFTGNQGDYSNIVGVQRDVKQKKGHTNQVTNYAGKTCVKIAFGLSNNPPKVSVRPGDQNDEIECYRAQGVEDFQDYVLDDNDFWKKAYRSGCLIQSEYGDAAIKTYPLGNKIKIVCHEDMSSIGFVWNGDNGGYDGVVVQMLLTPKAVYEQYKIKVNEKLLGKYDDNKETTGSGSWDNDNQWGTKPSQGQGTASLPTGKTKTPKVKLIEYDCLDFYALKIQGQLVEYFKKDDVSFPRVMFWTRVANIPNPPKPWSIADIDYLIDPQIEVNDIDNRTSDHLRVGNVQRYVAYNVSDLDPESISTSSGQVIFIDDPQGNSRFEPLPTNINNFPDDQYHQRKLNHLYDMGLPKVNYGSATGDSGRGKAIDYQSSIDLTIFKRDAWELALQEICAKIQILGNFLLGKKLPNNFFTNTDDQFVVRKAEFDWSDILPVSQSDKIVNIANKFNMIGLSLKQAYKELGYRNPDAMIEELKKELADPDLMILRSKSWQISQGLLQAQAQASMMGQSTMGDTNQPSPTLTPDQNTESAKPMASKGGTTSYSSAAGLVDKARQNKTAQGG